MTRDREKLMEQIIEMFNREDEVVLSRAYGDGGIEGLFQRLHRAALNQISEGEATCARYAIWANTLRDNILHAIRVLNDRNMPEVERYLTRAANSLSAFSEVQALCDPMKIGQTSVDIERKCQSNSKGRNVMDRKETIHTLLDKMGQEVLEYIKEKESSCKDRWVPATDIKASLELYFECVPRGNQQYGKKGWLFAVLARMLEDKGVVEYKKVGSRAFYRSLN